MRVKLQLPSKVAIKENWGTLPEVTERATREMRRRRSRGDGWVAGIRNPKVLTTVRRPDWTKTQFFHVNPWLTEANDLLWRLITNVMLW